MVPPMPPPPPLLLLLLLEVMLRARRRLRRGRGLDLERGDLILSFFCGRRSTEEFGGG